MGTARLLSAEIIVHFSTLRQFKILTFFFRRCICHCCFSYETCIICVYICVYMCVCICVCVYVCVYYYCRYLEVQSCFVKQYQVGR